MKAAKNSKRRFGANAHTRTHAHTTHTHTRTHAYTSYFKFTKNRHAQMYACIIIIPEYNINNNYYYRRSRGRKEFRSRKIRFRLERSRVCRRRHRQQFIINYEFDLLFFFLPSRRRLSFFSCLLSSRVTLRPRLNERVSFTTSPPGLRTYVHGLLLYLYTHNTRFQ